MSDLPNAFSNLRKRTHAQYAIIGAAIIEERLLKVLLTKMRPLRGQMKERLFDGYGPLSTFSAKIDLSYALQLLTKGDYDDLMVVARSEMSSPTLSNLWISIARRYAHISNTSRRLEGAK